MASRFILFWWWIIRTWGTALNVAYDCFIVFGKGGLADTIIIRASAWFYSQRMLIAKAKHTHHTAIEIHIAKSAAVSEDDVWFLLFPANFIWAFNSVVFSTKANCLWFTILFFFRGGDMLNKDAFVCLALICLLLVIGMWLWTNWAGDAQIMVVFTIIWRFWRCMFERRFLHFKSTVSTYLALDTFRVRSAPKSGRFD